MSQQVSPPCSSRRPRRYTDHYSSSLVYEPNAKSVLTGLILASCNPASDIMSASVNNDGESRDLNSSVTEEHAVSNKMSCNKCKVEFQEREEQMNHYKSDWHRHNLHLRLRGFECITEDQFENVADDVSSISGSEEEPEEEKKLETLESLADPSENYSPVPTNSERKFPKVFFKNESDSLISVYRCLLHHKKEPLTEPKELVAAASQLPNHCKWIILMISAGHFAGAVFSGGDILEHKTFHRYTIRAKRGTAQSSRDSQGNAPKSAGASLRRYNEMALSQEVQDLMSNWSTHLNSCDYIFARIPMANKGIFFGGKNPVLKKDDRRIRVIPFPTRRPTYKEVKRVHQMLASVECYGPEAAVEGFVPLSPQRIYDDGTGQLEVRKPDPQRMWSPKRKNKPKHTSSDCKSDATDKEHTIEKNESGESSEPDMELVELVEKIDLLSLREFDHTPKKKRNRKGKNKKNASVSGEEESGEYQDEQEVFLKNSLFTACKTGNYDNVRKILGQAQLHYSSKKIHVNQTHKSSQGNDSSPLVSVKIEADSPVKVTSESTKTNSREVTRQSDSPEQLDGISSQPNGISSQPNGISKPNGMQGISPVAAFLNQPLGKTQGTFLHLASSEGNDELVTLFLEEGADPALKDKLGKLPYIVGGPDVRDAFRRFMANFPNKFNYEAAQIPSALTPEMEEARRQKLTEKRKAKKKAANERLQERKAEGAKTRKENEEKDRFVALSDREKRALAAERRLVNQHAEQGMHTPVLSRCWNCGVDITGKTPFEYADFKFCTTTCLKEHRLKSKTK